MKQLRGGEAKVGTQGLRGVKLRNGTLGTRRSGGCQQNVSCSMVLGAESYFLGFNQQGDTGKRWAPSPRKQSATTKLAAPYLNALC